MTVSYGVSLLLLLVLLPFVAIGQTKPSLSNDFAADVLYTLREANHIFQVKGKWYSDYTDNRESFDATLAGTGEVLIFTFKLADVFTEYTYHKSDNTCTKRSGHGVLPHPFSFLSNAQFNGTCVDGTTGKVGNLWNSLTNNVNLTLCASQDGTTPFSFYESRLGQRNVDRRIDWLSYISGKPSSRYFVLPDACTAPPPL